MKFRPATADDLHAVVKLLADDVLGATRERLEDPLPAPYTEAFKAIDGQPGNQVLVAVDEDDNVIGCLQLTLTPGLARLGMTRATIEAVRIARNHRNTGLGEQMFMFAIDEAKKAGCGLVQLTTDRARPDAHRFYEKLGFEPSHIGMKLSL